MVKKMIIPVVLISLSLTACGINKDNINNKEINLTADGEFIESRESYYPVAVTSTEQDGEKMIIKKYEIDSTVNPNELVEEAFEKNGYKYDKWCILRKKLDNKVETKVAVKQIQIKTATKDMNSVLKQAPYLIDYSDEQGYKGQLLLNTNNAFSESLGSKSYSYTLKETKTYNDLARNDSYYIPKTIEKNGRTLALADIDWTSTGTTLAGNSLLPSSYSATAYYEGTAYGSKSIGYQTTLTYVGEVQREVDNGYLVSVVYVGEKILDLTWLLIAIPIILLITGNIVFIRKYRNLEINISDIKEERKKACESNEKASKEPKKGKRKVKEEEHNE